MVVAKAQSLLYKNLFWLQIVQDNVLPAAIVPKALHRMLKLGGACMCEELVERTQMGSVDKGANTVVGELIRVLYHWPHIEAITA